MKKTRSMPPRADTKPVEPRAAQDTNIVGVFPLPIAPPALLIDPKTPALPLVMPITIKLSGPLTVKSVASVAVAFQGWTTAITIPDQAATPLTLLLSHIVGWRPNPDDASKTNILLSTTEVVTVQGDFNTVSKTINAALALTSTYSQ